MYETNIFYSIIYKYRKKIESTYKICKRFRFLIIKANKLHKKTINSSFAVLPIFVAIDLLC